MYRHEFPDDPHYRNDPAAYLRDAVRRLTHYEVIADPNLTTRVLEIDDRAREIRIRSGEPFRRFHELIGRATLYVIGGSAWAPEFHTRPRLTVVRDMPRQRSEEN